MTDATPGYAAMRKHHKRVEAMIADPELHGDLLLIGIALARWADYGIVNGDDERQTWFALGAQVLNLSRRGDTIAHILRKDIRRYDGIKDADEGREPYFKARCGAPMIRRQGPCGKSSSRSGLVADPDTGRKSWLAACSRHSDWFEREWANARQVEPERVPAANAGGVLARHLPEFHWHETWKKLDPNWSAPPEGDDRFTKPRLRLVLGDAS